MSKLYYESNGGLWGPMDEPPKCAVCGGLATYETAWSGVNLCNDPDCHTQCIQDNGHAIEELTCEEECLDCDWKGTCDDEANIDEEPEDIDDPQEGIR